MEKTGVYERHFHKALSNHNSVLAILDGFQLEFPYDDDDPLPTGWLSDPLLLLGDYLDLLEFTETQRNDYRIIVSDVAESKGYQWVWGNRLRLAAQIEFIIKFEDFL